MNPRTLVLSILGCAVSASSVFAQTAQDPFPSPLPVSDGAIRVGVTEFATLPDIAGVAPRMMRMLDVPGTGGCS